MQPDEERHERNERDLARIVQFASAVSLGATAAFLYSLKSAAPKLRLEFSVGTVIAFLVASALSWFFWRFVFRLASARQKRAGRSGGVWFATIAIALVAVTAAAFAYSVRDVGREKLGEVAIGAGAAFVVLSFFGLIIWRVGHFFSKEGQEHRRPMIGEAVCFCFEISFRFATILSVRACREMNERCSLASQKPRLLGRAAMHALRALPADLPNL